MGGADTRAGLHGDDAFDRHGQIDDDPVALRDPQPFERIGEAGDAGKQFPIGDPGNLAVIGLEEDGDLVAQTGFDVAVEAVPGSVQLAIRKPLVEGGVGFVEHAGEILFPGHIFPGQASPEAFVVGLGLGTQRLVGFHAGDVGLGHELRGRRENTVFVQDGFDAGTHDRRLLGGQ